MYEFCFKLLQYISIYGGGELRIYQQLSLLRKFYTLCHVFALPFCKIKFPLYAKPLFYSSFKNAFIAFNLKPIMWSLLISYINNWALGVSGLNPVCHMFWHQLLLTSQLSHRLSYVILQLPVALQLASGMVRGFTAADL